MTPVCASVICTDVPQGLNNDHCQFTREACQIETPANRFERIARNVTARSCISIFHRLDLIKLKKDLLNINLHLNFSSKRKREWCEKCPWSHKSLNKNKRWTQINYSFIYKVYTFTMFHSQCLHLLISETHLNLHDDKLRSQRKMMRDKSYKVERGWGWGPALRHDIWELLTADPESENQLLLHVKINLFVPSGEDSVNTICYVSDTSERLSINMGPWEYLCLGWNGYKLGYILQMISPQPIQHSAWVEATTQAAVVCSVAPSEGQTVKWRYQCWQIALWYLRERTDEDIRTRQEGVGW